jgi:hypothetical protein
MVGAAAAEVAEAPSSGPQPAQEDMPEVVHGRHLLPNPVKVPLPRLLVKAHRAMEEAEVGRVIDREIAVARWEKAATQKEEEWS